MIHTNHQSDLALKFIRETGTNLFLTGKAGTGKTTFLRNLKELSPKRMIVVAPTGVAAINAGGVTIHSFFQLPFGPYIPSEENSTSFQKRSYTHKFSREKINIIRSIDLLVIDEISMVRADLLDAISDVLRRYKDRNKPFGGVQLLLIGDMQQLAPVAKEEEWTLLKEYYRSPFFFDSKALSESVYRCIELTHVYRQEDNTFVRLLNDIRNNSLNKETIRLLNQRYIPGFKPDEKKGFITLTTHNYLAQAINNRKLQELPGETYNFTAEIKEDFPAYSYPTEEILQLKTGAQVMFVKNDSSGEKKYYNGKIGKIVFINSQKIIVSDEAGNDITVNKETWQNTKYTIDPETKEISETIAGSFNQYPLKTAWAITIHKSQGLTFEQAIIDTAAAFSHGQVYVALSRCKSLEGLVLSSPINPNTLVADQRIQQYTLSLSEREANNNYLKQAQHHYFLSLLMELFDFNLIQERLRYASYVIYTHLQRLYPALCSQFATARDSFHTEVTDVGARFQQQLHQLIAENSNYLYDDLIQDRIQKGTNYFVERITALCSQLPAASDIEIDNKETRKLVTNAITNFSEELEVKQETLKACRKRFTSGIYLQAKSIAQIQLETSTKKRKKTKAKKEAPILTDVNTTDINNPELYARIRRWRNETASQKGLPVYTILQQKALIGLSNTLPATQKEMLSIPGIGKKVLENYGEELMEMIEEFRNQ